MGTDHSLIRRIAHYFTTLFKAVPHVMCWTFVLALPIGYYPDGQDSTVFVLGVHGGTGRIASVLRGCEGQVLHSESNSFSDFSAEAYWTVSRKDESQSIAGLRIGHFRSNWGAAATSYLPYRSYFREPDRPIDFWYYNPNISIETSKFGIGFGAVLGDAVIDPEPRRSSKLNTSFHLRFGNLDKRYLLISMGENTPLISGGGIFDIGIGYRVGKSIDLYTGLASGFYDRAGFVQQSRFRLGRSVNLDLSLRLGSGGGKSESALATGLTFMFGKKAH